MKKTLGYKVVFLFLILLLSVMLFSDTVSASALFAAPKIDSSKHKEALDLTFKTVKGGTVRLRDFEGKPKILFFFTTWCAYCQQKILMLSKNYSLYGKQGIKPLVIDLGESQKKVVSFAEKHGLAFDVILDPEMKLAKIYGVVGVPTYILIDKEDSIRHSSNSLPQDYQKLLQ
jgi:cytochrome c biogenesis protein CcmG/thiol:disulfide interchange protein DsbE